MVTYCTTTQAGETCTHDDCSYRHDIIHCEPCSCSFPANLLGQHRNGKKHVRNAAANGTSSSITPNRHPPPSNLPNSQPVSLPSTSSPAISVPATITPDTRVTVSHEGGLDFEVEGTEVVGQPSFSPRDLAILVKAEVVYGLSVAVKLIPSPGTPESWCGLFDDSI